MVSSDAPPSTSSAIHPCLKDATAFMSRGVPQRLKASDVRKAALLCEESFRGSSLLSYVFPKAEARDSGVVSMFRIFVKYSMMFGSAQALFDKEGMAGVACLHNEESGNSSLSRLLRASGPTGLLQIAAHLPTWSRLNNTEDCLKEARDKHLGARYLYLDVLAVRPDLQGQGYGGTLLRHLLTCAGNRSAPVFLETSTESNIALYRHYGFSVLETCSIAGMSEDIRLMVRPDIQST